MHAVLLALLTVACPQNVACTCTSCYAEELREREREERRRLEDLQRIIREFDAHPPSHF